MTAEPADPSSLGICRLCARSAALRDSHIMPAFAYRWLKSGSVTGYMISDKAPNLRIQDGFKRPLLCDECEQLFSRWESWTAETIFQPLHTGKDFRVRYGSSFCKFCVSVLWRVLTVSFDDRRLDEMPEPIRNNFSQALKGWQDFLLGTRRTPAPFCVFAVPLPAIKKGPDDLPRNINRYILRTVDASCAHIKGSSYVFAKLCQLLLVGTVTPRRLWRDGKVHVDGGAIMAGDYRLPGEIQELLIIRAKAHSDVYNQRSARQSERADKIYGERLERGEWTHEMTAFSFDLDLFGDEAWEEKY